jgi:cell division initiation protein
MLTPQEITGKEFVKAVFGGYDMSVVDDFLETLSADYSALYKENAILKSKIKVLVEKVEEYRSTEDAMRMALLTAQKMGEDMTSEAKKKSEMLLNQTEEDIRTRLQEMKSKFADEEARLKAVKDETFKFITVSKEIMRQHDAFLSRIEEIKRELDPVPEPVPEPSREEVINDTISSIDSAVIKLTETDPFMPEFKDEEEKDLIFSSKPHENDKFEEDEPTSPRPKFDFNNLKFGANYSGE